MKPWQVAGSEALYVRAMTAALKLEAAWEGIDEDQEFATPCDQLARVPCGATMTAEHLAGWANDELTRCLPEELETELRELRDECRSLARYILDERRVEAGA